MSVKINDVARRAGVSIATVSLALNGNAKVNAETRRRVEEAARELDYRPNPSAQRLASRKSRQIGLVVPDIENLYYAALAQHTLNALLAGDYTLLIATSMNSRDMERRVVQDMIASQVEGLLVAPVEKPNADTGYLDQLREAGIPCVFVTSRYPGVEGPCVMCDLYGGMRALLEALYRQGRRRFSLLNGAMDVHCFDLRRDAYLDFCRAHGLRADRVHYLEGVRYDDSFRFAREMALEALDAVVCVNDMMALGAINALAARGVRVPGDIAVTGFDDSEFSRVSPLAITTVRQDVRQMAARAAKSILALIQGEDDGVQALQLIPCEVVSRGSA